MNVPNHRAPLCAAQSRVIARANTLTVQGPVDAAMPDAINTGVGISTTNTDTAHKRWHRR